LTKNKYIYSITL